ncbi:glycosyltransferase family 39 protein [bacterium]|nr:glycosyltransferase family 39 protein [bacterium]
MKKPGPRLGATHRAGLFWLVSALVLGILSGLGSIRPLQSGLVLRFHREGYPGYYPIQWTTLAVLLLASLLVGLAPAARRSLSFPGPRWKDLFPSLVLLLGLTAGVHAFFPDGVLTAVFLAAALALGWGFRRETARAIDCLIAFPMRRGIAPAIILAGLTALGVWLLNGWMIGGKPYVSDSHARLAHALILDRGLWKLPDPPWWEFQLKGGMAVTSRGLCSQYLPGIILLQAAALKLGSLRILPPLWGGGAILMTWLCGNRLYGRRTAFLGSLLLALGGMFLILAASYMDHIPALFFLMTSLWFGLRNLERPGPINGLGAGFALGYAALMRPLTAVGWMAPFLLVYLIIRTRRWREEWPAWLAFCIGGAIPAAFLLYFNYQTTGDPFLTGYRVNNVTIHSLGFTQINHHTPYLGLLFQINNFHSMSMWLFFWPVTSYLFIILLFILRPRLKDAILLLPLGALLSLYFFYPYQDFNFSPRFLSESTGPLALLSARGILETVRFLRNRLAPIPRLWPRTMAAALVGLFACAVYPAYTRYQHFHIDYKYATTRMTRAVEQLGADPLAIVWIDNVYSYVALPQVVKSWGGAMFLEDPGPEERQTLIDRHPERRHYLIDPFANIIPLSPSTPEENSRLLDAAP